MRRRGGRGSALLVAGLVVAAAAPPAWAQEQAARARAAQEFRAGEEAFKQGRFADAAARFEAAYEAAPHPNVLFNAIAAREKARELARAANLALRGERDKALTEADRAALAQTLARLGPLLVRLDVQTGPGALDLSLDGEPVKPGLLYVDPGDHVLRARFGARPVERTLTLVAGSRERVFVPVPETLEPHAPSRPPAPAPADAGARKPLGRVWFFVAAGATTLSGGLLVWSAVDTRSAYDAYVRHPNSADLDAGRGKQTRTNVLVGTTAALGAGTAALGLFAIEWRAPGSTGAALWARPGGVAAAVPLP